MLPESLAVKTLYGSTDRESIEVVKDNLAPSAQVGVSTDVILLGPVLTAPTETAVMRPLLWFHLRDAASRLSIFGRGQWFQSATGRSAPSLNERKCLSDLCRDRCSGSSPLQRTLTFRFESGRSQSDQPRCGWK